MKHVSLYATIRSFFCIHWNDFLYKLGIESVVVEERLLDYFTAERNGVEQPGDLALEKELEKYIEENHLEKEPRSEQVRLFITDLCMRIYRFNTDFDEDDD